MVPHAQVGGWSWLTGVWPIPKHVDADAGWHCPPAKKHQEHSCNCDQVGFITHCSRGERTHGELWGVRMSVLGSIYYRIRGFVG